MNYKALFLSLFVALPIQAETIYKELDFGGTKALVGYSFNDKRSVIDVMTLDNGNRVACVEFVSISDGKVDFAYYSHGGPNGSMCRSKLSEKERKELDDQFSEIKNKIKK